MTDEIVSSLTEAQRTYLLDVQKNPEAPRWIIFDAPLAELVNRGLVELDDGSMIFCALRLTELGSVVAFAINQMRQGESALSSP
jgi:hypothetical protein